MYLFVPIFFLSNRIKTAAKTPENAESAAEPRGPGGLACIKMTALAAE